MDIFDLRKNVVKDYAEYLRSFIENRDSGIDDKLNEELRNGFLWPNPLVQLSPSFEPGVSTEQVVKETRLHDPCLDIFCDKPDADSNNGLLRFYPHQITGFDAACAGDSCVLTTGTGLCKSLADIVPIVDHAQRNEVDRCVAAVRARVEAGR